MTLIVGLGNPGPQYAYNRHNIGFMVIDQMVADHSAQNISKTSFHGDLYKKGALLFLKPTTFMNLSGKSVLAVKNFYKCDEVIVIHDDLDLAFGALRYKRGGGHGGHNGLKSIDASIGKEYLRVRMGIGKPEFKSQVADFVLGDFNTEQSEHLSPWIAKSIEATLKLTHEPVERVASLFSQKKIQC